MAKHTKYTARGLVLSGILSIPIFLICGVIGLIAYTSNTHLTGNAPFLYVVQTMIPVGLKGFILAALLSIILSSAAGFLNAASIAFVNDIVKPIKSHYTDKHLLRLARISTVIVGVIAIIFALLIKNVLTLLLAAYNFWSPIILVPLVFAIFGLKARSQDFFAGAIFGILGSITWEYILHTLLDISPILPGLVCNLLAFLISRFVFAPSSPLTS
jgi:SSS family solute:Na+ symporter